MSAFRSCCGPSSHSTKQVWFLFIWHPPILLAGCGLPNGPAGLLGAAEGISYLTIVGIAVWSVVQRLNPNSKGSGIPVVLEIGSFFAIGAGIAVLASQVIH